MVFCRKSPRHVDFDKAAALAARMPDHVRRVGVFVDPDEELLEHAISSGNLHALQLHGKETPELVAAIRARHGRETWKAVAVKTRTDLNDVHAYSAAAELLLYYATTPEHENLTGGMGIRFDWNMLRGLTNSLPWGLSGGLDSFRVRDALA